MEKEIPKVINQIATERHLALKEISRFEMLEITSIVYVSKRGFSWNFLVKKDGSFTCNRGCYAGSGLTKEQFKDFEAIWE